MFIIQQHQANRWTCPGSGMVHPKFVRMLKPMCPEAASMVARVAPALKSGRHPPLSEIKVFGMYVCICNALTERHVSALLDQDVRTPSAVYRRLGCVPQCGKCVSEILSMLRSQCSRGMDRHQSTA
jgi:bacterioferritin-associated ferredoxin